MLDQLDLKTLRILRDGYAKRAVDEDGNIVSSANNLHTGNDYSIKVNRDEYLAAFDQEIARKEATVGAKH